MKLASVRAAVFLAAGGAYMIGERRAEPPNYAQWLVICRNKKRSDAVQLLVAYSLINYLLRTAIEAGRYVYLTFLCSLH